MSDAESYFEHVTNDSYRNELLRIRDLIRTQVPDGTEQISYGMPAFKYNGKYLIGYAAFKDHLSIFPGADAVGVFAKELADYKTAKGTIQFTPEHPLTDGLLTRIIELSVARIDTK